MQLLCYTTYIVSEYGCQCACRLMPQNVRLPVCSFRIKSTKIFTGAFNEIRQFIKVIKLHWGLLAYRVWVSIYLALMQMHKLFQWFLFSERNNKSRSRNVGRRTEISDTVTSSNQEQRKHNELRKFTTARAHNMHISHAFDCILNTYNRPIHRSDTYT